MKTILGWLSDPWLHLLGLVVVVLAVGSRMGATGSAKGDEVAATVCDGCAKKHDALRPCYEAVTSVPRVAAR